MKLSQLINAIPTISLTGDTHIPIAGITADSRKVQEGYLFVAIQGISSDGHSYIPQAIEQGAVAVICEQLPEIQPGHVTFIRVKQSTVTLGEVLDEWYDHPSQKLKLVGITGTNGKTTIASSLYELFRRLGYPTGLLSTVCNYIDSKHVPATHTTPDAETLYELLDEMVKEGCEYVFMEVSSHAIDQHRISGLSFAGGVFTNLTRDHLDYHKTFDNYLKAKKQFFDELPETAFSLTNTDDKNGNVMLQNTRSRKRTYSLRLPADYKGKILESHFEGTEMLINNKEIMTRFVGKFNAYNMLAVYGAAIELGEDPENTLIVLSDLHPVSGRFETVRSPKGYTAIVDYAHTPDALVNVLNSIHDVLEGKGRVITVVGAGGNRDKGKRPIMAKEGARLSDLLILTSDNPRFEEPDSIIHDMEEGLTASDKEHTLSISDRFQAIKTAITLAKKDDVILVAGKGHENYQDIKGIKHHFDDKEKLIELFANQKLD